MSVSNLEEKFKGLLRNAAMLFNGTDDNIMWKNKDTAELKSDIKEVASKCKEALGLLTNFPYL